MKIEEHSSCCAITVVPTVSHCLPFCLGMSPLLFHSLGMAFFVSVLCIYDEIREILGEEFTAGVLIVYQGSFSSLLNQDQSPLVLAMPMLSMNFCFKQLHGFGSGCYLPVGA